MDRRAQGRQFKCPISCFLTLINRKISLSDKLLYLHPCWYAQHSLQALFWILEASRWKNSFRKTKTQRIFWLLFTDEQVNIGKYCERLLLLHGFANYKVSRRLFNFSIAEEHKGYLWHLFHTNPRKLSKWVVHSHFLAVARLLLCSVFSSFWNCCSIYSYHWEDFISQMRCTD